MTTLCLSDLSSPGVLEFAKHPINLIREAVEIRCKALTMPADQRRACVTYALSLRGSSSVAWCISLGVSMAHKITMQSLLLKGDK